MITKVPDISFLVEGLRGGGHHFLGLIDGHPQISAIPIELQFYRHWQMLACDEIKDAEALTNVLCTRFRLARLKDGILATRVDKNQKWGTFDFETFEREVKERLNKCSLTRRNVFVVVHEAFFVATGRELDNLKVIVEEEDTSFVDHYSCYHQDFPNAKIFNLNRSPVKALVSMKVESLNRYDMLMYHHITSLDNLFILNFLHVEAIRIYKELWGLYRNLPENICFNISHEALVTSVDETMKKVAHWLGVEDLPCLRVPTVLGVELLPNSTYQTIAKQSKVKLSDRYLVHSNKFERLAIEGLYFEYMSEFGFEKEFFKKPPNLFMRIISVLAWLVPVKYEFGWILNANSRAFINREPMRPWANWIYKKHRNVFKALKLLLIPYYLIRSVPIYILNRVLLFKSLATGKLTLVPGESALIPIPKKHDSLGSGLID